MNPTTMYNMNSSVMPTSMLPTSVSAAPRPTQSILSRISFVRKDDRNRNRY